MAALPRTAGGASAETLGESARVRSISAASEACGETVFQHERPANIDRRAAVPAVACGPQQQGDRAVPAHEHLHRAPRRGASPVIAWCVGVLIAAVAVRE